MNFPHDTVAARVLAATLRRDDNRETWERSVAISGLLGSGDPEAVEVAHEWIEAAIRGQDSTGQLAYNDTQVLKHGHVAAEVITPTSLSAALGFHVLGRYTDTGDESYLAAARLQADAVMRGPRSASGGLSIRNEQVELWVDTLYMVMPFLSRLAEVTGEGRWADECHRQFQAHADKLVDPAEKLARHAWRETPNSYPQSTFWSRGTGWLLVAIMDAFAESPDAGDFAYELSTLNRTLARVIELQDRCGLWRNVLDDPAAKLEVSGSLMFAYVIGRGVQLGVVDAEHLEAARRVLPCAVDAVDADGNVGGVTVPPGGPAAPFGVTSYGQGFFLLAGQALRGAEAALAGAEATPAAT